MKGCRSARWLTLRLTANILTGLSPILIKTLQRDFDEADVSAA